VNTDTPTSAPADDAPMPLWEHLEEFRWGILKIMGVVLGFTILCTGFVDQLFEILVAPLSHMTAPGKVILNQAGPFDGIFTKMKIGLLGGLVLSFPFAFLILWSFVSPGLKPNERRAFWWIFSSISILFMAGVLLGYWSLFLMLPMLHAMGVQGADNIWRLNDYVTFVLYWEIAAGLIMELPLAMAVLVRLGLVDLASLRRWRPYTFLGMFILSAVITADPVSLLILGLALNLLYEFGIWASSLQKPPPKDMVG